MSGFFKKLFNRVIGKKEEEAPPPAAEREALLPPPAEREALPPAQPAPIAEPEPVADPEPLSEPPSPSWGGMEGGPQLEPAITPTPAPPLRGERLDLEPDPEHEPEILDEVIAEAPEPVPAPKPRKAVAKKAVTKKPETKLKAKSEAKKPEAQKPLPPPEAEPEIVAEPEPLPEPEPVAPPPPVQAMPEPQPLPAVPVAAEEPSRPKGWLSRLKEGLSKSSKSITGSITAIFLKRKLDKETLQDLEDVLLQADLGVPMAERIVKAVAAGRYDKEIDPEEVKRILASEVAKVLKPVEVPFNFGAEKPFIILVVGVNGAGKTTTIGKLGAIAAREGYRVMFAACDTFRAAAIEQLSVWGSRIGAKVMARPTGADASGLAFDAIKQAKEDGTDILFIDTAGRLQNKQYLMDELDKIVRVIRKLDDTAPHAVLLVLDATTGQNALAQADIFTKVAGVTGLIMTKLDGTARGGILVAIAERFKLPVHAIGVGEQIDDLQPFDAEGFARAIAGLGDQ